MQFVYSLLHKKSAFSYYQKRSAKRNKYDFVASVTNQEANASVTVFGNNPILARTLYSGNYTVPRRCLIAFITASTTLSGGCIPFCKSKSTAKPVPLNM